MKPTTVGSLRLRQDQLSSFSISSPLTLAGSVLIVGAVVGMGLPHAWLAPWTPLAVAPLLYRTLQGRRVEAAGVFFCAWALAYSLLARPYMELSPVLVAVAPSLVAALYVAGLFAGRFLIARRGFSAAALAATFIGVESVKSLCGLEYGNLAYGLWPLLPALGFVAWFGSLGASWIAWYTNFVLAGLALKQLSARGAAVRLALVLLTLGLSQVFGAGGVQESGTVEAVATTHHQTTKDRWNMREFPTSARAAILEGIPARAKAPLAPGASQRLILLPETACQFWPEQDSHLQELFGTLPLPEGTHVVAGGFGLSPEPDGLSANSVFVLDRAGTPTDRYDKVRLIPFDEAQPLEILSDVLFDRETLTEFAPGTDLTPLTAGDTSIGISICYEETFASGFAEQCDLGAQFLLTCGSYAYFSSPLAPSFMRAIARFRARECGRDLVRVVNMGTVDHISPDGRVLTSISSPGQDVTLDVVCRVGSTPFVAWGRAFALPIVFGLGLLGLLIRRPPSWSALKRPLRLARPVAAVLLVGALSSAPRADLESAEDLLLHYDEFGTLALVTGALPLELEESAHAGWSFELGFLVPSGAELEQLRFPQEGPLSACEIQVLSSPYGRNRIRRFYPERQDMEWIAFECRLGANLPAGAYRLPFVLDVRSYPSRAVLGPHKAGLFLLPGRFDGSPTYLPLNAYQDDREYEREELAQTGTWYRVALMPAALVVLALLSRRALGARRPRVA